MEPPVRPPFWANWANGLGAWLRRRGWPLLSIDADSLERAACRQTGLTDFGETGYREALMTLCRSLEEDATLSPIGRFAMRQYVTNALVSRLRRIDARRTRPEVVSTPLRPPLIIIGMPRTGTTLLHRLLALASDARSLALWEVRRPVPGPGRDRRRRETASDVSRIKRIAPGLDAKHHLDADEADECMFLFDSTLVSISFWLMAPVYGYLQWFREQDLAPTYEAYREHLQLFQAETPQLRLTLKAPVHGAALDGLFAVIPDAMVVQTHRDPVRVLSSLNSLFFTTHSITSARADAARMATANADLLEFLVDRNMSHRERLGDRVLDVTYERLVADPIGTVRSVHQRFDIGWDSDYERRLREGMARMPQHKFGQHQYSAEDFGMTDRDIARRFDAYRERFLTA